MTPRKLMIIILLLHVACAPVCAQTRSIEGLYRNPALGYSIRIPKGLHGVTGDQAGPERGVGISLPSGGEIAVYGEPNSAEYKSPEDGVRAELACKALGSSRQEIKQALVGRLNGAKGRLVCDDHVLRLFLAFRTHGGPIYWLSLRTDRVSESKDEAILETIVTSFRLIHWD